MFSAEYVVPPALSIPLGTSGSSVDVVKEENGTFSINGETITAETRVTAENGNVYRALLSPEGMPIGVSHVQAMQEVMLGDLGGTITLTQAEDKSWMLGDMTVTDGYEYTAANGNVYVLMMDPHDEHMHWTATYQEVMVTVALGTQGSVTLTRAEDMSWWLGSEAVMTGSTVNSANGNEYMLSYADGAWMAMFQPVSMMIEGTGLTAMTREGDDMFDVGDATLPASGKASITVGGAMYHVWMAADGGLAGARTDSAINGDTDHMVGHLSALPTLSADDKDTPENELRTMLTVGGSTFSLGSLLDAGGADAPGSSYVAKARGEIETIRDQVTLLVEAFDFDGATRADKALLKTQLDKRWDRADTQIQKIFPDKTLNRETDEDEVVDAFDDLLDALSSLDQFEAALKSGDDGVFEGFLTDSGRTAQEVYDARSSEARALFGSLGDTRFGAVAKKERANATSKLKHELGDEDGVGSMGAVGAFAWATINDTVRTHHIQTSGSAYYEGETIAASGDGTLYTGDIAIEVRFTTEKVDGLVTNLVSEDGEPWTYLYGDVHSIGLPRMDLKSTASWGASKPQTNGGIANFAPRPGSPVAQKADATFAGNLLGTGDDAGSQAVGVWSFGKASNQAKSSYISGGFGAERTATAPGGPAPPPGDESEIETVVIEGSERKITDAGAATSVTTADGRKVDRLLGASLGDGNLTILGQTSENAYTDDPKRLETFQVSLATAVDKAGSTFWTNSDTQVALARAEIENLRNRLAGFTAIDEDPTIKTAKQVIWTRIATVLQARIFSPGKVKRAEANGNMEVLDALGQKIFADLDTINDPVNNVDTANAETGNPLVSDDLASVAVDIGKIVSPDGYDHDSKATTALKSPTWKVRVAERKEGDPSGLVRLSGLRTPVANDTGTPDVYAIYKGDLINAAGLATVIDNDASTNPSEAEVVARKVKLVNQLVNGNIADLILGGSTYPTRNTAGDGDDTEALSIVDDVIAALQSKDALADALERGGALEYLNLSETATGDPDDPSDNAAVGSGDIWNRKEARVQLQLGTTNYTRFGVWRKQTNNTAANQGYKNQDSTSNSGLGPGAFAYSSLPATEYLNVDDPAFPGGASATYTGETVALQTATYYTGLISVTVNWDNSWTGLKDDGTVAGATDTVTDYKLGSLTAVISGLESANGDPLQYIKSEIMIDDADTTSVDEGDNPATDIVENTYVKVAEAVDIREVIFRAVSITTSAEADKNQLNFSESFIRTTPAATDPMVRLVTNVGGNPTTVLGGTTIDNGGSTPATDAPGHESAMLVGTFVGQNVDGPLGVLGRWQLMDQDGIVSTLTASTRAFGPNDTDPPIRTDTYSITNTTTDVHRIGTGALIHGAFGAELEP